MAFFQSVLNIQKKNLQHKIDDLDKLLNQENKNLVFIGTIGVGKTSAICSLFNLFDITDGIKRPILKTGAGATTICEVEIEFAESYSIKIDPYSIDEVKQLIIEFLDSIIGNNNAVDGQPQQLTTELERAIKFMIAPNNTPLIEIDNYIKSIVQKNNGNKEKILDELFSLADLMNRNEVIFKNNADRNDKSWLRTTFSNLNDGKYPHASLPKKFYITIPSENNIKNKIIDTKGIDSRNQNTKEFLREDLDRYIKNPDNLIIYCSSFTAAPDSDIMQSIMYYTQKDADFYKRMILLIIPKHDQPEHVAGVDGNLNKHEYLQGLEIRKVTVNNQIIGQINNEILILTHNSSLSDNRFQFNNIENDIILYQNQLIQNTKIEKNNLTTELNNIKGHTLTPEQLALEKQIIANIRNLQNDLLTLSINTNGFTEEYADQYRLRYAAANTKNAIHTRLGIFNTKNVYFDFEVEVEYLINNFFNSSNILSILQLHLGINQEIIKDIIPSIHENFLNKAIELNSTLSSELRNNFSSRAFNYDFWQPMISRWGRGPGYNNDVKARLQNQMQLLNIDGKINAEFISHWRILVNELINELS